jgi:hypothetical protein
VPWQTKSSRSVGMVVGMARLLHRYGVRIR